MKRALVTAPGQDGSFLCDILLAKGYEVSLLHRHSSADNLFRVRHVLDRVQLLRGDVTDEGSFRQAIIDADPDEIYHVADQDNVGWSKVTPAYQARVTYDAVETLLTHLVRTQSKARVFLPLSCTMFGDAPAPQNEESTLHPESPYAQHKRNAWMLAKKLRQHYGLHVCCGIMFNHDSERRAPGYLLQDVCRQAIEVARGRRAAVSVGNLAQRVDVGYAKEYMEAAVAILQLEKPDDYCIGTGRAETIRWMAEFAFAEAGVGGLDAKIKVDPRPTQPEYRADISKARVVFGFAPSGPENVIKKLVKHFKETT